MTADVTLCLRLDMNKRTHQISRFDVDLSESAIHWDGQESSYPVTSTKKWFKKLLGHTPEQTKKNLRERVVPQSLKKLNVFARMAVAHKLGEEVPTEHFRHTLKNLRSLYPDANNALLYLGGFNDLGSTARLAELFADVDRGFNRAILPPENVNILIRFPDDLDPRPAEESELRAIVDQVRLEDGEPSGSRSADTSPSVVDASQDGNDVARPAVNAEIGEQSTSLKRAIEVSPACSRGSNAVPRPAIIPEDRRRPEPGSPDLPGAVQDASTSTNAIKAEATASAPDEVDSANAPNAEASGLRSQRPTSGASKGEQVGDVPRETPLYPADDEADRVSARCAKDARSRVIKMIMCVVGVLFVLGSIGWISWFSSRSADPPSVSEFAVVDMIRDVNLHPGLLLLTPENDYKLSTTDRRDLDSFVRPFVAETNQSDFNALDRATYYRCSIEIPSSLSVSLSLASSPGRCRWLWLWQTPPHDVRTLPASYSREAIPPLNLAQGRHYVFLVVIQGPDHLPKTIQAQISYSPTKDLQ